MILIKNKKTEKTRIKEILKDIKNAYKTHEHKGFMAVVYSPANAKEIREERYEIAKRLRKIYQIIKNDGIEKLPKKADREYYLNELYKKQYDEK